MRVTGQVDGVFVSSGLVFEQSTNILSLAVVDEVPPRQGSSHRVGIALLLRITSTSKQN